MRFGNFAHKIVFFLYTWGVIGDGCSPLICGRRPHDTVSIANIVVMITNDSGFSNKVH